MDTTTKTHEQVELQDLGNGHWRAVCGDRSFRTDERDSDLWVDHRELAGFAGEGDSRDPGRLLEEINRGVEIGLVAENGLSREVRDRNDGKPGKKQTVILLRRREALLVLTQCTFWPRAIQLTQKMADVFEQWLDRRHQAPQLDEATLVRILVPLVTRVVAEVMAPVLDRLSLLERRVAEQGSHGGLISPERRRQILDAFQFFADCFYSRQTHRREWSRKRAWFDKETRKACLLPLGMGWDRLPAARDDLAENKLRDLRDTIPEQVRRQRQADRDAAKQMPLGGMN